MSTLLALILMVDAGAPAVPVGAVELKVWRSMAEVPHVWRPYVPKDFDFEKEQLALASGARGGSGVSSPRTELSGTAVVVWPSPRSAQPLECGVCRGVHVEGDAVTRLKVATVSPPLLYRLPRSAGAVFEAQVPVLEPRSCPPCLAP